MKTISPILLALVVWLLPFGGETNAETQSSVSGSLSKLDYPALDLTQVVTVSLTLGFAYSVLRRFNT